MCYCIIQCVGELFVNVKYVFVIIVGEGDLVLDIGLGWIFIGEFSMIGFVI